MQHCLHTHLSYYKKNSFGCTWVWSTDQCSWINDGEGQRNDSKIPSAYPISPSHQFMKVNCHQKGGSSKIPPSTNPHPHTPREAKELWWAEPCVWARLDACFGRRFFYLQCTVRRKNTLEWPHMVSDLYLSPLLLSVIRLFHFPGFRWPHSWKRNNYKYLTGYVSHLSVAIANQSS